MKRRVKEARVRPPSPGVEPDWLPLLDEELSRLPEKYRLAIVLCDLEDRPRTEVAERLGIPEGTLSSRLTIGRRRLADRLRRRGVSPGEMPALAVVPTALLDATLRASKVTAGHLAAGTVPAAVASLAIEVTRIMLVKKLLLGAALGTILLVGALALLPVLSARTPTDPPAKADPPPPKAKPAAPELPAWKKEFNKTYALAKGEILKRVAPPFPECRMDYYRIDMSWQHKHIPDPPVAFFFTWKGGKPEFRGATIGANGGHLEGVTLGSVLDQLGVPPQTVEGTKEMLERRIPGDWVVRDREQPDQLVVRLQEILRKEVGLAVKLTFKEEEREVAVARGKFVSKPVAGRKENTVDFYALKPLPDSGAGGGSGTLPEFFRALGSFVKRPVVSEVEGGPKKVTWYFTIRSPMIVDPANGIDTRAEDTDPKAVLPNVEAQTGLTITLEKRKVRVLVVEKE